MYNDTTLQTKLTHPSQIIRFIAVSEIIGENWREKMKAMRIRIVESDDSPLVVFNYGPDCDFSNPVVQEARGIIIDIEKLDVVCWPFRKFGNWNESYADRIDWESAKITEKIDGSIIKLYYYDGCWNWATNSTISADQAHLNDNKNVTFLDVIKRTENYKEIPFDSLDKNCTYLFELVSPETQVVIRYDRRMLYHIGTRNNLTGKELDADIGIIKPKLYTGEENLEFWKTFASNMNEGLEHEGFVVVDKNYNRIKIKTPEYLIAHRDATLKLSKNKALEVLMENYEKRIEKITATVQNKAKLAFYRWQLAEFELKLEQYIAYVRGYYEEVEHDRKAIALAIKGDEMAKFGFEALNRPEMTAADLIARSPLSVVERFVGEYRE